MKCHPCGQDNASNALFCTACRRPLVAPSKLPTRLEPATQPAMAAAGAASPVDSSYGGDAGAPTRSRFASSEATSRMGGDTDILTDDIARHKAARGISGIAVIVIAVLGTLAVGILAAVVLPAYRASTVKAKVAEAVPVGNDVAAAVGKHYEQTGQLPNQVDVDGYLQQAPHQSKYVSAVDLDSASGTITVHVSAHPADGTYQLVPSSDNNHHLSWTCSSPDKLALYMPASCRR